MRGAPSSHEPGGSSAGTRPAGVSTSRQRLRARNCGCCPDRVHVVDLRVGDLRVFEPRDDLLGGQGRECFDDEGAQLRAGSASLGVGVEAGVLGELGASSTLAQNAAHSRSFCRPSITTLPSPAGKGP